MSKILIHTLEVKPNAKLQFQIKLPSTINRVKGIYISHPFKSYQKNRQYPISSAPSIGWLWLRVPDERDVFFAEVLRPQFFEAFEGEKNKGLSSFPQWRFNGTKIDFFAIDVPIKNTIISGFYWDKKTNTNPQNKTIYTVKIYLKLG